MMRNGNRNIFILLVIVTFSLLILFAIMLALFRISVGTQLAVSDDSIEEKKYKSVPTKFLNASDAPLWPKVASVYPGL